MRAEPPIFEHRSERVLTRGAFARRMAHAALLMVALLALALGVGVLGYRLSEGMTWVDALFNASMILSGMGPAAELHSVAGKLFASAYALFSGVFFIALIGVAAAPIAHRFLHQFHADEKG